MQSQHFDVLIIGAGLSGIGTACHLSRECPDKRFAILERRDNVGGTWDLFRYPGIRSDSDMFSFGFKFRPWNGLKVLADGPSIRQYIGDTAAEFGVHDKIHFGVDLADANWCSAQRRWTLQAADTKSGAPRRYTCDYLISCTGYYDHHQGYTPEFSGIKQFKGQFIHPQQWPENLHYRGKKVVVIGSGATAVTLVPAMAEDAEHVTMLQRSPTYVLSIPAYDKLSEILQKFLPESWVFRMARWRNIKLQRWMFKVSKRWPKLMRALYLRGVRKGLGEDFDMRHFTPDYMPWDQRLCAIPDSDLFDVIKTGKASVVTDEIDAFTKEGIRLKSGEELEADIVISATGLKVQVLGGMQLRVDGEPVIINRKLTYKAVLMEGVPNMSWIFGYTNAPWTLKADIAARYVCRLLNHMGRNNQRVSVAIDREDCAEDTSVMSALQSGYVQRGNDVLPRQGRKYPWRLLNDYEKDAKILLEAPLEDGILQFYSDAKTDLHFAVEAETSAG
ncbi:Predicted flavoprotein CzcO associated with the cation diffusion facilitator CzcD [Microbulbifer donghaiensis]|uniref:Predicted flavoprotein CzcO associated with the cation diffusion facilitator CzcD n=1 Tax=Microbulbifer donghaiensis TaxID=494016 RepID=A0A1M4VSZ4_9GAMM|nr:NAD(P)/FAD-dependent oxidoreductase [Microbulbifer donghaiensis]SHE72089.1 Predicted flavoprotein CzcO associated with the cation diffusion facilitator CzcD [Microbulbifer donghaiensis]